MDSYRYLKKSNNIPILCSPLNSSCVSESRKKILLKAFENSIKTPDKPSSRLTNKSFENLPRSKHSSTPFEFTKSKFSPILKRNPVELKKPFFQTRQSIQTLKSFFSKLQSLKTINMNIKHQIPKIEKLLQSLQFDTQLEQKTHLLMQKALELVKQIKDNKITPKLQKLLLQINKNERNNQSTPQEKHYQKQLIQFTNKSLIKLKASEKFPRHIQNLLSGFFMILSEIEPSIVLSSQKKQLSLDINKYLSNPGNIVQILKKLPRYIKTGGMNPSVIRKTRLLFNKASSCSIKYQESAQKLHQLVKAIIGLYDAFKLPKNKIKPTLKEFQEKKNEISFLFQTENRGVKRSLKEIEVKNVLNEYNSQCKANLLKKFIDSPSISMENPFRNEISKTPKSEVLKSRTPVHRWSRRENFKENVQDLENKRLSESFTMKIEFAVEKSNIF